MKYLETIKNDHNLYEDIINYIRRCKTDNPPQNFTGTIDNLCNKIESLPIKQKVITSVLEYVHDIARHASPASAMSNAAVEQIISWAKTLRFRYKIDDEKSQALQNSLWGYYQQLFGQPTSFNSAAQQISANASPNYYSPQQLNKSSRKPAKRQPEQRKESYQATLESTTLTTNIPEAVSPKPLNFYERLKASLSAAEESTDNSQPQLQIELYPNEHE